MDDQGHRRQGQDPRTEGTIGASPAKTQEGLRRRDQGKGARHGDPRQPVRRFARDKGRQVAETLLQGPDATIVYAHNDEMALGAIAAIEAAGKVPGKDISSSRSTARRTRCRRSSTVKMDCHRPVQPALRALRPSTSCTPTLAGDRIDPVIINPDRFFFRQHQRQG